MLSEPGHPDQGRGLPPLPCRLVLAGASFLGGACCVAGVLVTTVRFTSFRDADVLTPHRALGN